MADQERTRKPVLWKGLPQRARRLQDAIPLRNEPGACVCKLRGPGPALPNDVHQGGEEGLHLVVQAMLGTECLDQGGHPAVVVPWHRGKEAGRAGQM